MGRSTLMILGTYQMADPGADAVHFEAEYLM